MPADTPRPGLDHFLPAAAVALCGIMWGCYWYPLRWLDLEGVGGGWTSLVFNGVAALAALPWLMRHSGWQGLRGQALTGLLLGAAFSLYTVSLVLTDVIHAILLFYLTPVWSTLGGRLCYGQRLSSSRLVAMFLGFAGLACILGFDGGLPLPRNAGDWLALASGIGWAAGTLRSYASPTPGVALPLFTFATGGLAASALILAIAGGLSLPLASAGQLARILPLVVILGLAVFVPPNLLVLWAAQRLDPGRVGILLMTEVLTGTITAAIFSGEPFGLREALGTVLIVCAGLIEVLGRR